MCNFMSCVSDGHGTIKYFTLQNIVEVMAIGNPKTYSWNSHTSICQFFGINSKEEDKWNKWEFNPETSELVVDSLVTTDDRKSVEHEMKKFFHGKDIVFMRNLYNRNSGDLNSGYGNSGNLNSGNRNSGNLNSGNRNSGDLNSGDLNSGDRNSGDLNSGDRNSGYGNSGDLDNSFCQKKHFMLFDKPCTEEEYKKVFEIDRSWFNLCEFIWTSNMTEQEKADNPSHVTCEGFIRIKDYKEAWKSCPKSELTKIKKLKNFNAKTFEAITGIKT